jgi:hypothetical protein
MDVAAQKALHALVEKELKIQRPGVGERDHKTGEAAASTANSDLSKMRPVHLALFSRESTQAEKRFPMNWAHTGHKPAQLYDAAAIATIPNHLENPGCPKAWMLGKDLANEIGIRIRCTAPQCFGIAKTFGLNGKDNGFRM